MQFAYLHLLQGKLIVCMLLQDPRRYFGQASDPTANIDSFSTAVEEQGASVADVLRSINPHKLQSGMTAATASQARSHSVLLCTCLKSLLQLLA